MCAILAWTAVQRFSGTIRHSGTSTRVSTPRSGGPCSPCAPSRGFGPSPSDSTPALRDTARFSAFGVSKTYATLALGEYVAAAAQAPFQHSAFSRYLRAPSRPRTSERREAPRRPVRCEAPGARRRARAAVLSLAAWVFNWHVAIAKTFAPRIEALEYLPFLAAMYFIREADEELLIHHSVDRNQLPSALGDLIGMVAGQASVRVTPAGLGPEHLRISGAPTDSACGYHSESMSIQSVSPQVFVGSAPPRGESGWSRETRRRA